MIDLQTISIAIAEDSLLFAQALQALLKQQGKTEVLFTAHNGATLLQQLKTTKPQVILMDIRMPDVNGLEATTKVKELYPDIYVIVLSNHHDLPTVKDALKAGADGYLLKDIDSEELQAAIEKVAEGETYLCEKVQNLILINIANEGKDDCLSTCTAVLGTITERECQVLKLICLELTSEEIAADLFISKNTVETHRRNLLAKLDARSSIGLVKWAIKQNIHKL